MSGHAKRHPRPTKSLLRIFVAAVLAVAADAVLVARHLPEFGNHLATSLARLHVKNPERTSGLESGSTRQKKGREERRNVENSLF